MEQKRPSYLLTDKHASAKRKQNEETAKAFYLLTRIAAKKTCQPHYTSEFSACKNSGAEGRRTYHTRPVLSGYQCID